MRAWPASPSWTSSTRRSGASPSPDTSAPSRRKRGGCARLRPLPASASQARGVVLERLEASRRAVAALARSDAAHASPRRSRGTRRDEARRGRPGGRPFAPHGAREGPSALRGLRRVLERVLATLGRRRRRGACRRRAGRPAGGRPDRSGSGRTDGASIPGHRKRCSSRSGWGSPSCRRMSTPSTSGRPITPPWPLSTLLQLAQESGARACRSARAWRTPWASRPHRSRPDPRYRGDPRRRRPPPPVACEAGGPNRGRRARPGGAT